MSYKEKLPKLVDVYRSSDSLGRRQLPLIVDENLTLVMDLRHSGLVCDNPLIRGKELEEFSRKCDLLTVDELHSALEISKSELMEVLNQNVACVGCRRSVERLYYQLFKLGHSTLDPLVVTADGLITVKDEKQIMPQVLGSIFYDHSKRLAKVIENQPKRSKKSVRCLLHSLDSQRNRPLSSVWKDVWTCMQQDCKKDVCIIEASSLYATLETYLQKHRFCGECRTKVLKAYTLLIEETEPCKEKGYIASLYAGIKKCLPDRHLHLPISTDYITKLIRRAEPELLGSRRERHAKTLEIAQEEVLTCLGICIYERLHRIYMRMREEECTCQMFVAVAVDSLSRSFETAVESKQGFSQLELLYAELAKDEQRKQLRKEQKKIKRRRKKERLLLHDEKENCNECVNNDFGSNNCLGQDFDDSCDEMNCCKCEEFLLPLEKSLLKCSDSDNNDYFCDFLRKHNNLRFENGELWVNECKCKYADSIKSNKKDALKSHNYMSSPDLRRTCDSFKYNYTSENNGSYDTGSLSSVSSSPEGSEVVCYDLCCQHDLDFWSNIKEYPSLQQMLQRCSEEDDDGNCKLTPEEVWEFETNNKHLTERRRELREALKKRFIDFCVYGPLPVPRLLIHTKYTSN